MEFLKTDRILADYKDIDRSTLWENHTYIEVVFIDKSQSNSTGYLYQLKDQKLSFDENSRWKTAPISISSDEIILLAEVQSINRQNKTILLSTNNTVSYKYLIAASGLSSKQTIREIEFAAGLQALVDALRVKPKIPSSFAPPVEFNIDLLLNSTSGHLLTEEKNMPQDAPVDRVSQFSIASANQTIHYRRSSITKRLYEVQL